MIVTAVVSVACLFIRNAQCLSLGLPNFNLFPQNEKTPADQSTLILLHVLFRHGNRTGQKNELYPKDPYLNFTYFPFGNGQLTNEGKRKEYYVGKALRNRYGDFLGPNYYPEIVDAVSTDYNRTKMSLQLVLASLFEPKGIERWNSNLNWQPVPYNYLSVSEDKVLQGNQCPNYIKKYNEELSSTKLQGKLENYKQFFSYISNNTGLNVKNFVDVYNLFFGLSTEEEWGFKLPEWTRKVWPNNITQAAIKEYFVATGTTDLTRMASGYLIKKIIEDTQNKILNETEKHGRKIYLYSAHESNVAEMQILLDVFKSPHVPTYGSYIVFEVHKINNRHGIKIYYENYASNKIQLLKLPACDEFCPLKKFISLVEEYIPSDDLCGNEK